MTIRLIFDTQYFRRLKPPELHELRRRGYALSVSSSAFLETWTRSLLDKRPGLFFGPARNFARFVDPAYPIAAAAGDLCARLGARAPNTSANPARFIEATLVGWKHAATSNSEDPFYALHGAEAQRVVQKRKEDWVRLAAGWPKDADVANAMRTRRRSLERAEDRARWARAGWRYIVERHPAYGMAPPLPPERFNAYLKVVTLYLLEVGGAAQQATANDAQDILQLMHVGEHAILVTHDRKLLGLVDRSGTFQAPWVRSLAEVLDERLPRGRPWGEHARRVSRRFHRQKYDVLRRREEELLARLRGSASDP